MNVLNLHKLEVRRKCRDTYTDTPSLLEQRHRNPIIDTQHCILYPNHVDFDRLALITPKKDHMLQLTLLAYLR